ncbi:hypothetical protein ACVBGC_31315 [Burkholderia stagnalis]
MTDDAIDVEREAALAQRADDARMFSVLRHVANQREMGFPAMTQRGLTQDGIAPCVEIKCDQRFVCVAQVFDAAFHVALVRQQIGEVVPGHHKGRHAVVVTRRRRCVDQPPRDFQRASITGERGHDAAVALGTDRLANRGFPGRKIGMRRTRIVRNNA